MKFYALLADIIVVVHFLYVLFAVGGLVVILVGALRRWALARNALFRTIHLAAVGLVTIEAALGIDCPLTVWEFDLRQLAGQLVETNVSFVARLARLIVFYDLPHWFFTALHITFGVLVIVVYVVIRPGGKRDRVLR